MLMRQSLADFNVGLWEEKSEHPYCHEENMFNRNTGAVSHEGKWVLIDGYFSTFSALNTIKQWKMC